MYLFFLYSVVEFADFPPVIWEHPIPPSRLSLVLSMNTGCFLLVPILFALCLTGSVVCNWPLLPLHFIAKLVLWNSSSLSLYRCHRERGEEYEKTGGERAKSSVRMVAKCSGVLTNATYQIVLPASYSSGCFFYVHTCPSTPTLTPNLPFKEYTYTIGIFDR